MVVWTGYGLLTVVIAVLFGAVGEAALQPALHGVAAGFPPGSGLAIGLVAAAIVNWVAGSALNSRPGRELLDPRTGERVVLRRRHTLFWIPMQYWSIVLLIAGVACLIVPSRDVVLPVGGTPTTAT